MTNGSSLGKDKDEPGMQTPVIYRMTSTLYRSLENRSTISSACLLAPL